VFEDRKPSGGKLDLRSNKREGAIPSFTISVPEVFIEGEVCQVCSLWSITGLLLAVRLKLSNERLSCRTDRASTPSTSPPQLKPRVPEGKGEQDRKKGKDSLGKGRDEGGEE